MGCFPACRYLPLPAATCRYLIARVVRGARSSGNSPLEAWWRGGGGLCYDEAAAILPPPTAGNHPARRSYMSSLMKRREVIDATYEVYGPGQAIPKLGENEVFLRLPISRGEERINKAGEPSGKDSLISIGSSAATAPAANAPDILASIFLQVRHGAALPWEVDADKI